MRWIWYGLFGLTFINFLSACGGNESAEPDTSRQIVNTPATTGGDTSTVNPEIVSRSSIEYIIAGQGRRLGFPSDFSGFCSVTDPASLPQWTLVNAPTGMSLTDETTCTPMVTLASGFINPSQNVNLHGDLKLPNNQVLSFDVKVVNRPLPTLTLPRLPGRNPEVINLNLINNVAGSNSTIQFSNGIAGITALNGPNYISQFVEIHTYFSGVVSFANYGQAANTNRPYTFPAPVAADPLNAPVTIELSCDAKRNQYFGQAPLNPPQPGFVSGMSVCPLNLQFVGTGNSHVQTTFQGAPYTYFGNPSWQLPAGVQDPGGRFYGQFNVYAQAVTQDGARSEKKLVAYIPWENNPR